MNLIYDITTSIKSKQFDKTLGLLKDHQKDIDGRTAFKFLRCLATQLKLGVKHEENGVKELLEACCEILFSSQDLATDDSEFTQGILALHHLVTPFVSSGDKSGTCQLLAKTFLFCIRKMKRSIKDVESIVASFFAQIWNFANKVSSDSSFLYRSAALTILVHGGSIYRGRLVEKLVVAVQDLTDTSLQVAESVFEELVFYHDSHSIQGSQETLNMLLVWAHIVHLSNPFDLQENRTSKLKYLSKDTKDSKTIDWLIDLVLCLFGVVEKEMMFSSKKLNELLTKESVNNVFVRIVLLALNSSKIANQLSAAETKNVRPIQMISILSLFLYFAEQIDLFESIVSGQMQMDVAVVQTKCLSRACSMTFHLLKNDPSNIVLSDSIFASIDQLLNKSAKNHSKVIPTLRYNAELTSYNTSIILLKIPDYVNATKYSRKALEYLLKFQFLEANGQVLNTFVERFTLLYDCRKMTQDWVGVIDDFELCLQTYYNQDKMDAKNCKSDDPLFSAWSRFKRDIQHGTSAIEKRLSEMTIVDLCKQANVSFDRNGMWHLLYQEFLALNRRKGSMPKVAFSAIAQQAHKLAKTPFQKGVSCYLLSRDGHDYKLRQKEAENAIVHLEEHSSLPGHDSQGQVYIALCYVELYVSQQEILRKKTEEEMESLGPLIQSSNIEIPPGEDASSVAGDGTSLDALSYSYLKIESELKNQEWMAKSLVQWEELVETGWVPQHYNNVVFNCMKSLGYYFRLYGNSFFSARVWLLLLEWTTRVKCDEELILAASELLKLGWAIKPEILLYCHEVVEKETVIVHDQILFYIGLAWSNYFEEKFIDAWQILDDKVFKSPILTSETTSKSALLLTADASLLRALLIVMPGDLSKILQATDTGPIQIATKAVQSSYSALKCYVLYAQQQNGWDFYGQEWNVLRHFLDTAIHLSRLYLYTAAPREARFYLKEALNTAQRHISVLRTAEALLEFCNIDLMLDNTIDCQSKLVLICHLMDVAPLIFPEPVDGSKRPNAASPASPVAIRSDRRRGIAARKVPEAAIPVQLDATHRFLQMPYMHQGASPTTKTREISGGVFSDHLTDCICFTCTSELITSIRCASLLVQAKLWSCMGFHDQASEDFLKGQQYVETVCARLKNAEKNVPAITNKKNQMSKRLFDVPEGLDVKKIWSNLKMRWFQPAVITGMELLLEHVMHRVVNREISFPVKDPLIPLKTVLYQVYTGPLQHRVMKLISGMALLYLPDTSVQHRTPESGSRMLAVESQVAPNGSAPKTPALGLRKPIEMPAPRRVRRNLSASIGNTITIDDDEDSDCDFSRRRLGQPTKAILYSSDSDSDVVPPTPPPHSPVVGRMRIKKKAPVVPDVLPIVKPVEKKYSKRGATKKAELTADDPKPTSKTVGSSKTKDSGSAPSVNNKTERKFFKSKSAAAAKGDVADESELSNRLAATKITAESQEVPPKRTTRSTRK